MKASDSNQETDLTEVRKDTIEKLFQPEWMGEREKDKVYAGSELYKHSIKVILCENK